MRSSIDGDLHFFTELVTNAVYGPDHVFLLIKRTFLCRIRIGVFGAVKSINSSVKFLLFLFQSHRIISTRQNSEEHEASPHDLRVPAEERGDPRDGKRPG